jgi:hypothetical protein
VLSGGGGESEGQVAAQEAFVVFFFWDLIEGVGDIFRRLIVCVLFWRLFSPCVCVCARRFVCSTPSSHVRTCAEEE